MVQRGRLKIYCVKSRVSSNLTPATIHLLLSYNMMTMSIERLIEHAKYSYYQATCNISKLSESILDMNGMSGKQTRHLYNNLCSLDNITYVEVGTYTGSSLISAIYHNNLTAYAIENWSEFYGPKEIFMSNVNKLLSKETFNLIEKDFHNVTIEDLNNNKIDIFMYDGMHTFDCQYEAIIHFYPFMNDNFIIIVDDWNSVIVSEATIKAMDDLNVKIVYQQEIITNQLQGDGKDTFWDGFGLFICSKEI